MRDQCRGRTGKDGEGNQYQGRENEVKGHQGVSFVWEDRDSRTFNGILKLERKQRLD